MASLLCHLHFWTLKALSPRTATGSDIGTHIYHEKSAGVADRSEVCRRAWAEGRGITWTPRNKKPERLRDTLRECEELLSTHRPICLKWKALRHCLILLDNGILLTFTVAKHSGDVEKVMIDRTLVGKHATADNALIVGSSIMLTLAKDPRPVCVTLSVKRTSGVPVPLTLTQSDSGRRIDRISARDPKVTCLNVKGMPPGLVQRHLVSNSTNDLVVVWWRDTQDSGWQWSSMADSGPHNLIVFKMNQGKPEYGCGIQTEGDPVDVQFSKTRSHIIFSLEKAAGSSYDCCTYELADKKLVRVYSEAKVLSSEANVVTCERNKDDTKLLLGCEDGTLILHDSGIRDPLQTSKAYFAPISLIRWHPAGSFAFVCSHRGEIQCFDLALNPLLFQQVSEDPAPTPILQLGVHLMAPAHLELAGWGSELRKGEGHGGCYDNFIAVFDRGPVVLLRLELGVLSRGRIGPVELVAEYIRHSQLDEAVALLRDMSWNSQGKDCFSCFTIIMHHLITQPLSAITEAQLESTLATFLAPRKPLSRQVHGSYSEQVLHYARNFFHLLLRYRRMEKAFRLAVDISAKDLFMDIHFIALDRNETKLAEVAKQKAESIPSPDILADTLQSGLPLEDGPSPSSLAVHSLRIGTLGEKLDDEDEGISDQRNRLYSFDSVIGSYSPYLEQATMFESSDRSSVTASEHDEYSDSEATQEAVEDS